MSSPPLHRLFYVSRSRIDPCGAEPRRILDVATQRNAQLDITGVLVFSGDHFAQVLEGAAAALDELMVSIRADPRHQLLREWPQEAASDGRWFPGWSMGYAYDERLEAMAGRLVDAPQTQAPLDMVTPTLFAGLELYRGPADTEGGVAA